MYYFSFYWWYFLVLKRKQKNRLCSLKNNLSGTNCITEMFPRYLLFHCLWVNIQTHLHGLWVHMTKFHGLRVYGPRSMGPCHCDLVPLSMCPWPSSMPMGPYNPVPWSMGPHDPVPWSRVHMTHNVLQRHNSTTCKGITIADHTISRHLLKSVRVMVIFLSFFWSFRHWADKHIQDWVKTTTKFNHHYM